jgi:ATP-binding cassette, subfamily A (ABC1), member 3
LLIQIFRDEADVLADRIAVMAGGQLKANGSSFFLKKQCGLGYRLVCNTKPSCKVDKVTNLLKKYIPKFELTENVGTELSYSLGDTNTSVLQRMFGELEASSEQLNLESSGISMTTLEEVFHK